MISELGASGRDVFGSTLVELGRRNPNVVVLDGDLANSTKADRFAEAYPERFLEMGLAEQNMLGAAAGLAAMGFVPFISTFACFAVDRALDQIRVLIAQTNLGVKIVGSYGGLLVGLNGKTHQVLDDFAVMRSMPHMTVIAPGDDVEARQVLEAVAELDGPCYVRLTRDQSPRLFGAEYRFNLGRAVRLRDGGEIGLISTGTHTARVLAAADELALEGIATTVLHVPTIKPLDVSAILEVARQCRLIVTAEEHIRTGGLGGAVAEVVGENHPIPVIRTGIDDTFAETARNEMLLEKYGLTARYIATAVREAIARFGAQAKA